MIITKNDLQGYIKSLTKSYLVNIEYTPEKDIVTVAVPTRLIKKVKRYIYENMPVCYFYNYCFISNKNPKAIKLKKIIKVLKR